MNLILVSRSPFLKIISREFLVLRAVLYDAILIIAQDSPVPHVSTSPSTFRAVRCWSWSACGLYTSSS